MAFCLAELHLWSTKSSLQVKDTDIGTYQYYDKGEPANPLEHHYYHEKLQFCEARGHSWTPRNRRPEKLRDSLKELEELLQTNTCVCTRWRNKHCCQLMLSSGILLTLTLHGPQLEHVCVDRTLAGRLPASTVTDAVLSERLMLLSFLEQSQVAAVVVSRKNQDSPETGRRTEKLSPSEVKVVCVEVAGQGRRLARRVALNHLQDVALCWWNWEGAEEKVGEEEEEPWPWCPADIHRNNLVLLSCSPTEGLKALSSLHSSGTLLDCSFSQLQPYHLLTVEMSATGPPESSAGFQTEVYVYDCARGRLQRLSVVRVALAARPLCCARHPWETSLLLGLSDSSLLLYDQRRGVSLQAPCPIQPTLLAWHPAGAVAVVGGVGQGGELMCFDVGLAPLRLALLAEDEEEEVGGPATTLKLTQHLRCSGGLQGLWWGAGPEGGAEGTDMLMLAFDGGPLAYLRFRLGSLSGGQLGPSQVLQQRLRCGQVREALDVLEAMDWCIMGDECFRGLSSVINHLLRLPLTARTEAQLQAALAVFYAPPAPISEALLLEYRQPISKYARRFFHHLLRHQRLEKAFLLAVDLEDRDLFMDLHYAACDKGEAVLADVAARRANQTEARDGAAAGGGGPRAKEGVSATSFVETSADRNQSATGRPSMQGAGEGHRRRRAENTHVTVDPDVLRTLILTGGRGGPADGDGGGGTEEDQDAATLRVVHLGMV